MLENSGFRAKDRIIRINELVPMVGLCRRSIYYLMGNGKFPKSVTIGERAKGWRESEISQWIDGAK